MNEVAKAHLHKKDIKFVTIQQHSICIRSVHSAYKCIAVRTACTHLKHYWTV